MTSPATVKPTRRILGREKAQFFFDRLLDHYFTENDVRAMAELGANVIRIPFNSAMALVGLERFPEQARQREEMAAFMDEALSEIPGVRVLPLDERHTTRSFYRYIFAINPAEFGVEHDVLCGALDAEGIECWVGYEAMHKPLMGFAGHYCPRSPAPVDSLSRDTRSSSRAIVVRMSELNGGSTLPDWPLGRLPNW